MLRLFFRYESVDGARRLGREPARRLGLCFKNGKANNIKFENNIKLCDCKGKTINPQHSDKTFHHLRAKTATAGAIQAHSAAISPFCDKKLYLIRVIFCIFAIRNKRLIDVLTDNDRSQTRNQLNFRPFAGELPTPLPRFGHAPHTCCRSLTRLAFSSKNRKI